MQSHVAEDARAALLLIQQMAGTWDVEQRMWPGRGAEAIALPEAVAQRRLVGSSILSEEMELAPGAKGDAFTRIACFNYNGVSRQYEYFSIDTRAPQMMNERSYGVAANQDGVSLRGDMFVAPRWGEAIDAAFRYRLTVGQVSQGRQIIRLYLTPVSDESGEEFLALEYFYIRRV